MATRLEREWKLASFRRRYAISNLFSMKGDVEILYNPFAGTVQIGMGGEWWSGKLKGTGKHIFRHRKERVDPDYQPVTVDVRFVGNSAILFDVSGGFGREAAFRLELR